MISVAMCTYNGAEFIKEQLDSIMEQTLLPDEIVVCDDCSTDKTISIVEETLKIWNGRIKIHKNRKNLGYKMNFQQAISFCHGDIIFLSDQDDVWKSNKIERCMAYFNSERVMLVFHDVSIVNLGLKEIQSSFWHILKFDYRKFLQNNYCRLLEGNIVQGSACAFRRQVFEKALPFPKDAIHDEWIALVAVTMGELVPIPEMLMLYRQGNNQIGALEQNLLPKVIKWIKDFRGSFVFALQRDFNYIVKRINIFNILVNRYPKNNEFPAFDYLVFFQKRNSAIRNKSIIKILSLFPKDYIKYCSWTEKLTVRLIKDYFIKDILCIICGIK